MRTFSEYLNKLRTMRPNIYMGGQKISRDDPRLAGPMNNIKLTFDLAQDEKYKGLLTATSHITAQEINRFTHIHRSPEDLLKKQEMTRTLCRLTPACIQRCMGVDMLNAISVFTHEIDQAKGTSYYPRFLDYLKYFQENDLVGCAGQTDVKGDRKLRPHQQKDPDLYLRLVERRRDGIIVRGAKAHNSIAAYADEILVTPTRLLTKEEADWAVAFAIPADAPGIKQVVVAAAPRARKILKAPVAEFGSCHSLTIFEDVLIPWERVFMCGEWEFGGRAASLFALYHRHSYTGCKPAFTDVIMGTTALVAEYNGVEGAQHINHKLADLISVAELVYGAGIAAAVKSKASSSGTYIPDVVFCNVGRRHAGENLYHEYQILCDVAGGLPATLPYEEDFYQEEVGSLLHKYIMRKSEISAENQHRCFRMIHDLIGSSFGAHRQIAGLHGGGSPIMEVIALLANYDLKQKKEIAKHLAGITSC
ncbi:MAG: 4-hydroxyphenylacetate 3-hydroxylase family protein [Thermodesulfobacteriota bacterium]